MHQLWGIQAPMPVCADDGRSEEHLAMRLENETSELELIAQAFRAISKEISHEGLTKLFSRPRSAIPESPEALCC
jgi:hypothetical protein